MITAVKESSTSPDYNRFKALLNHIMAVPHTEIVRREAEYKRQSDLNPNKPGPKPKRKRAVGRVPAV